MILRNLAPALQEALSDRPVVLLNGARQVGKSTLAQSVADGERAQYLTLDDATVLAAASSDPGGFVAGLGGPVILDEVQRAPGLFPAIKLAVDRDRRPGRFLLTGSADVFLLPSVSESLAGRECKKNSRERPPPAFLSLTPRSTGRPDKRYQSRRSRTRSGSMTTRVPERSF